MKKFDLAFAVDPLFHKTSAQFDEGGARGEGARAQVVGACLRSSSSSCLPRACPGCSPATLHCSRRGSAVRLAMHEP